ncbi:MAG: RluA family pseudouridine synthase [Xanthomonadales bacterium]|nr:RluA family pseudouridine synthase [Xanthomonadales bacterium]
MAANDSAGPGVRLVQVAEDRAGQRLDNFLAGQFKGVPKSVIYRIVRTGQVRVNGKRAKPDTRLEGGDEVRLPPVRMDTPTDRGAPGAAQIRLLQDSVIFEDRAILAISKPSGIASHGGSGVAFGAIEILRAARPNETLELVHRLDRDTSGVLVLARKRSALTELQRLMREGGVHKRYLSLLAGRIKREKFTVDAPLERSVLQGGERMVRVDAAGKDSVSHFRVIDRFASASYVEVEIETGRTHQIRVHAGHSGHPVLGDDKYGDKSANAGIKRLGLKRLFLHAAELRFALEDGAQPYVLNAPLPDDLRMVLDRLVQGAG